MIKRCCHGVVRAVTVVAIATLASSCSASSIGDNYRHLLALLCTAPPTVMQGVLTTPEQQVVWRDIWAHT